MNVASLHNFRDLGGLRTDHGRSVRPGLVYRSDALTHLTDHDVHQLRADLGIRTIVDLRSSLEHDGLGRYDASALGVDVVELPVIDGAVMRERSASGDVPLGEMYRFIADHGSPRVRQVLELVADEHRLPLIVACSSGKDRTGIVVAVLLRVLGVRRDEIVADYERSATSLVALRARVEGRLNAHGVTPPPAAFELDTRALEGVLDDVVPSAQAVERYLGAGVDDLLGRLRQRLLSPGGG